MSLLNDILDLSKVEAGRMELELGRFDFPGALESAITLVKERASRRGVRLELAVDERLGDLTTSAVALDCTRSRTRATGGTADPEDERVDRREGLPGGRRCRGGHGSISEIPA